MKNSERGSLCITKMKSHLGLRRPKNGELCLFELMALCPVEHGDPSENNLMSHVHHNPLWLGGKTILLGRSDMSLGLAICLSISLSKEEYKDWLGGLLRI